MKAAIIFLACAIFFAGAVNVSAQPGPQMGYQIVPNNMGPWLYRMNTATGEVCAIKTITMEFAYASLLGECPGYVTGRLK